MNKKIYKKIAKKYGVTAKEVKHDMQFAIDEAYKNPNFYARCVYSENEKPIVEEFIKHVANRIKAIK